MDRRLPVYVLADCSESMVGERFASLQQGLHSLLQSLRGDASAMELGALSLITFASAARQVFPLTDIPKVSLPKLSLGSGTALGDALRLWERRMAAEVVTTTATRKGDFKPLCFLLTDGEPTDDWRSAADHVRTSICGRKANVIAVAIGPDADVSNLRSITETVLVLKDDSSQAFQCFFRWVSASVSTATAGIATAKSDGFALPTLPRDGVEVAPVSASGRQAEGKQVFLHARCVKRRGFYLMKYQRADKAGAWASAGAYAVEDFQDPEAASHSGAKVNVEELRGGIACPYCGDKGFGMCPEGHIHCVPDALEKVTITCPWCESSGTYALGSFDVGTGAG